MESIVYDDCVVEFIVSQFPFTPCNIMPKAKAKAKAPVKVKASVKVKAKTAKRGAAAPKKAAKAKPVVRGGNRSGAGRPIGSGKYGCKTKAVRVPEHMVSEIQAFIMKKVKAANK